MEICNYCVSVSSCRRHFFVSILPNTVQLRYKTLNSLVSLFIAHSVSQYTSNFGDTKHPNDFLEISESMYSDFEVAISGLFDPTDTSYIGFIVDGNIVYSQGNIPYKGDEYFDVISSIADLSDLCLVEPFAAYESHPNVVVFPFFKHLQVSYINKQPLDEECTFAEQIKTRLLLANFTLTRTFLSSSSEEEEDKQVNVK